MKILIRALLLTLLLSTIGWGQEQVDLTTPETRPSINSYRVARLVLDRLQATVEVTIVAVQTGELKMFEFRGDEATQMMSALNTANLSTNSLQRRILNKLVNDGLLVGTITGTPE